MSQLHERDVNVLRECWKGSRGVRVGTEDKAELQKPGDHDTLLPPIWHNVVAASPKPECPFSSHLPADTSRLVSVSTFGSLGKHCSGKARTALYLFPSPREEMKKA